MNELRQSFLRLLTVGRSRGRMVGIVCAIVICAVALCLDGRLWLRISMWLITCAAVGGAIISGYLASRAGDESSKNGRRAFCIAFIIIGALVWSLIPSRERPSDATVTYWLALEKLTHNAALVGHDIDATGTQNIEEGAQKLVRFYSDFADQITQLPITMVDSDAVDYAAEIVRASNGAKSIFEEMLHLANQKDTLTSRAKSAPEFFETLVRTMLGDPLGTYNQYRSDYQQLGNQWQQVQSRWEAQQHAFAELDVRELKLRAILSNRYHREFPRLSPRKK